MGRNRTQTQPQIGGKSRGKIFGPGQVAFNNKIIEHQSIKLSQVQHKLKDQIVMGRKAKGECQWSLHLNGYLSATL